MSQQEMNYVEMDSGRPGSSYSGYESVTHNNMYGEKLSGQAADKTPTAGQRLALAICSLVLIVVLALGLTGIAAATQASSWVVIPILFVLVLFSAVAVIINVVFNRRP